MTDDNKQQRGLLFMEGIPTENNRADVDAVRLTLKPLGEYFQLFRDEVRVIAFPIAGWFVLWFFTGSPRILPWKHVTNDD